MKILGILLLTCYLINGTTGHSDVCAAQVVCPGGTTLKVSHTYEGQYINTEKGTLGTFGPTPGPLKLIHAYYTCALSKTACEGQTMTITCQSGTINVRDALFGRYDTTTCGGISSGNTNCRGQADTYIVKNKCNGKTSCTLRASIDVFQDPCSGIYKYLKVYYVCIPPPSRPTFPYPPPR